MFWIVACIVVVLLLLAYRPRALGRLLIVLSFGWIALVMAAAWPNPPSSIGVVLIPPAILWGGVFVTAWISRA